MNSGDNDEFYLALARRPGGKMCQRSFNVTGYAHPLHSLESAAPSAKFRKVSTEDEWDSKAQLSPKPEIYPSLCAMNSGDNDEFYLASSSTKSSPNSILLFIEFVKL